MRQIAFSVTMCVGMAGSLFAQAPTVENVFNSASAETRLAPGALVTLRGSNLVIFTTVDGADRRSRR